MGAVKSGAAAAAAGLLLSLFLPLTPAAEASVPENMVKMAGQQSIWLVSRERDRQCCSSSVLR